MDVEEHAKSRPTDADIAKLNAEVNYYLNQQYTLLISTVTIIGLVVSWVSQKVSVSDPSSADLGYLGSLALLVFIGLMVIVEARLQIAINILAAYLRLSGVSMWEAHHDEFVMLSNQQYGFRVTSRHLFLTTSVATACLWPFILSIVVLGKVNFTPTVYFFMGAIVLIAAFVFLAVPFVVRLRTRHIERTWKQVMRKQELR